MQRIPDGSVDMILCDLPYGTTACKWDAVIPFEPLWEHYKRVAKKNAAIILTASQPFTTALALSNLPAFKYAWVWDKKFAGNFVQASRMPLRTHEDVLVFSFGGKMPNYYPQKSLRESSIKNGGNKQSSAIPIRRTEAASNFAKTCKEYADKHPITIISISNRGSERGLHPTQKPVALFEYLIRTYTNEGETVLDNAIGSGTTPVACMNTGRHYIGFEKDPGYFSIAQKRIAEHKPQLSLTA
jgi:site-specific DNA-methyltransferase (adenine-specific)